MWFVLSLACGAPDDTDAPAPEATVAWYTGTVATRDPADGTLFFPEQDTAARRRVDPTAGTIVEEVVSDGEIIVTTMTRRGEDLVFDVTDDGGSVSGTLTFAGAGWDFTGWTYDLTLTDGSGTLTGTATIDATAIHTDKVFHDPDGADVAQIEDTLAAVDEATWQAAWDGLVD